MAHPDITTRFYRWHLTPEEVISGQMLSEDQIRVMQNMQADTVDMLLNLPFDAANPMDYGTQKAFMDGQLAVLSHMLDKHRERVQELATEIRSTSQEN